MVGQLIGSYRVLRVLGEGGMGVVYEAVHEQIERRAAIKVLHPEISRSGDIAARFFNEARAVNIIRHAGVVGIFEFGNLSDGSAYLVMEYLEGESLADRLRRHGGRLGVSGLRLARQVASTLAVTHAKNIIHRDLKPDNIMIVPEPEMPGGERAKILDFGIAKVASAVDQPQATRVKTRTGMIMGTPAYMAPEQCRGAGIIDGSADVYSLGVILYQMLAGRPPFIAEGAGEIIGLHLFVEPTPLRELQPDVAEPLASLVHRMLAKAPAQRPSMAAVAAELEELTSAQNAEEGGADRPRADVMSPTLVKLPPTASTLQAASGQQDATGPRRNRRPALVGGVMALAVAASIVVIALVWWKHGEEPPHAATLQKSPEQGKLPPAHDPPVSPAPLPPKKDEAAVPFGPPAPPPARDTPTPQPPPLRLGKVKSPNRIVRPAGAGRTKQTKRNDDVELFRDDAPRSQGKPSR